MKKPMWTAEAVKAYESGQGVELVNTPHPHYRPLPKVKQMNDDDDIQEYVRPWVGLTKNEIETLSYIAEGNTWVAIELAEAKLKEKNK
jgi:hypothetical protein